MRRVSSPSGRSLVEAPNAGDIGRRVAVERKQQGLTRAGTARRARMAPDYLAYLAERPTDPNLANLIRLTAALGTTVAALRGGGIDPAPGTPSAYAPISTASCRTPTPTRALHIGCCAASSTCGSQ